MKHIEVRYHHIRELVIDKKLDVRKVDTEVNIVDSLTKPLPHQHFTAVKSYARKLCGEQSNETKV